MVSEYERHKGFIIYYDETQLVRKSAIVKIVMAHKYVPRNTISNCSARALYVYGEKGI